MELKALITEMIHNKLEEANEGKVYAVRMVSKGYVIFGPYENSDEARADAGPSLENILPSRRVSRKTRQNIDAKGSVILSSDNYKRMVSEESISKKPD